MALNRNRSYGLDDEKLKSRVFFGIRIQRSKIPMTQGVLG